MNHLTIANSSAMLILCAIAIIIVVLQAVLFFILGLKRAKELGIKDEEVKETIRSSAIFSILPSLPIIVSYLVLIPALGRFFPWLRLSVVGSPVYETMVANMAAEAYGFEIMDKNIPLDVFLGILFLVSIAILGGNIFNIFFLKSYDKRVESLKNKNSAVVPIITTGMFLAVYGIQSAPFFTNIKNVPGIVALFSAGIAALLLGKVAEKFKGIKEFVFPASMVIGMFAACIASAVLRG